MTQRVPSYYDNIVEDHSYTMFSTYPPTANVVDHWQIMNTKDENAMVRDYWFYNTVSGRELHIRDWHAPLFIAFVRRFFFYLVSDNVTMHNVNLSYQYFFLITYAQSQQFYFAFYTKSKPKCQYYIRCSMFLERNV